MADTTELYDRMMAGLVASWERYAEASTGASIQNVGGADVAIFPEGPKRCVYNNAVLERGADPARIATAVSAFDECYADASWMPISLESRLARARIGSLKTKAALAGGRLPRSTLQRGCQTPAWAMLGTGSDRAVAEAVTRRGCTGPACPVGPDLSVKRWQAYTDGTSWADPCIAARGEACSETSATLRVHVGTA
jgi:hypothetical protein